MYPIAASLLEQNKQTCIDQVVAFINTQIQDQTPEFVGFPQTPTSAEFCVRDTTYVINAYIKDLLNGNNRRMLFVSSRYWIGSLSGLVGNKQKEVIVHNFLKDYIINNVFVNVEPNADEFLISEHDTLIDVILNGPQKRFLHNILPNRFTAHWWDNTPLEDEKLETILECAYQAPSKNGKHEFEIVVLTDSPAGKEFKQWLYWENSYCLNNVREAPGPGLRRQNGQVLAPVVLVWVAKDYDPGNLTNGENDALRVNNDCMVSATMAMCSAEELGVQTGFCNCIGWHQVSERLNMPGTVALTTVGFGYATSKDNRHFRPVFKNGVKIGYDYSNTYPTNRTYENRNRRPAKRTMIHIV